ncbi:hypothetical protein A0H81_09428 [Grifola frondosa]|uniref:Uncharacterized protein n=1 Tax=Grifola frondosa TaxID=5627 RepID=A0A1C7M0W5_GRIFR|nr:hypothetical protein A0H81_09428 [Grifola frondosa]
MESGYIEVELMEARFTLRLANEGEPAAHTDPLVLAFLRPPPQALALLPTQHLGIDPLEPTSDSLDSNLNRPSNSLAGTISTKRSREIDSNSDEDSISYNSRDAEDPLPPEFIATKRVRRMRWICELPGSSMPAPGRVPPAGNRRGSSPKPNITTRTANRHVNRASGTRSMSGASTLASSSCAATVATSENASPEALVRDIESDVLWGVYRRCQSEKTLLWLQILRRNQMLGWLHLLANLRMRHDMQTLGQHLARFTEVMVASLASRQPDGPHTQDAVNGQPDDIPMDVDDDAELALVVADRPPEWAFALHNDMMEMRGELRALAITLKDSQTLCNPQDLPLAS